MRPSTIRRFAALAVAGLAAASAITGSARPAAADPVGGSKGCKAASSVESIDKTPWPQTYLHFDRAWSTTRGKDAQGRPVTVAVIDSGFSASIGGAEPTGQMALMEAQVQPGINTAGHGESPGYVEDCGGSDDERGHGTRVASLIAAPQGQYAFVGVAPEALILPIKAVPDNSAAVSPSAVAEGITQAVKAKASVINISIDFPDRGPGVAQYPELAEAVRDAQDAGVVIVAAAGNFKKDSAQGSDQGNIARYPAAFAGQSWCHNVISVGSIGSGGQVSPFSVTKSATTIVAPGENIVALQEGGGYFTDSGTSFAAPIVSGVVALMRAAHPDWNPDTIRRQLEYTAQGARGTVPDPSYGYGTVDPVLAVTAPLLTHRPDSAAPSGRALGPPRAAGSTSRTRQHVAVGLGIGFLGLALVLAIGASVLRAGKPKPRRRAAADSTA